MVSIKDALNKMARLKFNLVSKKDNIYKFKVKGGFLYIQERGNQVFRVGTNTSGNMTPWNKFIETEDTLQKALNFAKKNY